MEYDKSVIEEHQIFIENKAQIDKFGIEQFLNDIGIFIEIIPFYKHPNSGGILIGFTINIQYRLNEMIDDKTYKMEIIDDYKMCPSIEEARTAAILKAYDIITSNNYFKDRINKVKL